MTRKQRAADFLAELERKHWEHQERLAKAATLENATRYRLERAVTREYRKVHGVHCTACNAWQMGGVFALFEPWRDTYRVCGWLCQFCARESDIPFYPNVRVAPGSPMDSNAPKVARVKGGFLLNWPGGE